MKRICILSFILLSSVFFSCAGSETAERGACLEFRGADISFFARLEEAGVVYKKDGENTGLFSVLRSAGVNWIRLRLWHTPADGNNSLEKTVAMAARIKREGFNFLLDIHYSDSWADPSSQVPPAAWSGITTAAGLASAAASYTQDVLDAFIGAGCTPDMIQTGNEITGGMFYPYCRISGRDCSALFEVLASVSAVVRKKCPSSRIMLHIDRGGDKEGALWWFSQAELAGADYDVIGLSYYPFFHGTELESVEDNIAALKKCFGRTVCIVETAYMWTTGWNDGTGNIAGETSPLIDGYPASSDGQKGYLRALCNAVAEGGGSGVFWWEPQAVCAEGEGSSIENLAWFDFDNNYNGTGDVFKEFQTAR